MLIFALLDLIFLYIPVQSVVICTDENECQGYDIAEDVAACYGHQSCSEASINCTVETHCSASSSCIGTEMMSPGYYLYCYGESSCRDSTISNVVNSFCYGSNSCYNTSITISQVVVCDGDNSCSSGQISITDCTGDCIVEGIGAYSLNNAIIDSGTNGDSLYVELAGFFAGYGATIHCLSGSDCTIDCYGNACMNVNLMCDGGSSCTVLCDDSDSVACPNGEGSGNSNVVDFYDYQLLLDVLAVNAMINEDCDDDTGIISNINECDDGNQCTSQIFDSDDSICCRGAGTCDNNGNIVTNGEFVTCSGYYSCDSDDTPIEADKYIYCSEYLSCYQGVLKTINHTGTIVCGQRSCPRATIYDAKELFCNGGFRSCFNTSIIGVKNIYALGGDHPMRYSTIISGTGSNDDSNNETEIYCNGNGTICHIECGVNSACSSSDTNIFCLNGGNCTVYCDESIGIECPNAVGNVGFISEKRLQIDSASVQQVQQPQQ